MPRFEFFCLGPDGCGYRTCTWGPCVAPGCKRAAAGLPMQTLDGKGNLVDVECSDADRELCCIPRELACSFCGAWLEVPGPCPVPMCEGSELLDACDVEFFCVACLRRKRRAGTCETQGCERHGKPLREHSQRSYEPTAEAQLADAAFGVESRRHVKPS